MEPFKLSLVLIASAMAACAGTIVLKAADGVSYYYGSVSFLSPDGRLPYRKTETVVRREIMENGDRILETVSQPSYSPSMKPEITVTELRRRGKTLVYDASDRGRTFSGTVTFRDTALMSWTYEIKMQDGSAVTGKGELTKERLLTEKQLTGVKRPMMIRDDLKSVSEGVYRMRLAEFYPPGGAE